jgi:hypothetical protein
VAVGAIGFRVLKVAVLPQLLSLFDEILEVTLAARARSRVERDHAET